MKSERYRGHDQEHHHECCRRPFPPPRRPRSPPGAAVAPHSHGGGRRSPRHGGRPVQAAHRARHAAHPRDGAEAARNRGPRPGHPHLHRSDDGRAAAPERARAACCIPRALVEDTLASCARNFVLHGRDPKHDMEPSGNKVYFGTAGAAVHIVEPETRSYREFAPRRSL